VSVPGKQISPGGSFFPLNLHIAVAVIVVSLLLRSRHSQSKSLNTTLLTLIVPTVSLRLQGAYRGSPFPQALDVIKTTFLTSLTYVTVAVAAHDALTTLSS